MSYLNRLRTIVRAYTPILRRCLLIAGVLGATSVVVQAAPVTFRFDATIATVLPGNPFDLPFSYQIGDVISGQLTFEPGAGIPTGDNTIRDDQFLGMRFVVNGTEFGSSTYSILVFDNDLIIADDLDISNGIVVDTMVLECSPSSSQACTPDLITIPGGAPFRIGARFTLTGASSIYNIPEISADPAVWNSFELRRLLNVSFGNQMGGSMSFLATVHAFTVVPEPSSSSLVVGMVVAGILAGGTGSRTGAAQRQEAVGAVAILAEAVRLLAALPLRFENLDYPGCPSAAGHCLVIRTLANSAKCIQSRF